MNISMSVSITFILNHLIMIIQCTPLCRLIIHHQPIGIKTNAVVAPHAVLLRRRLNLTKANWETLSVGLDTSIKYIKASPVNWVFFFLKIVNCYQTNSFVNDTLETGEIRMKRSDAINGNR